MAVTTLPDGYSADRRSGRSGPWTFVVLGLMAAAGAAIQSLWCAIDADVSWLITVCERMIAGDRLYVDILELNPPASVWLYFPFVWLAHIAGVKSEIFVAAGFIAAASASTLISTRLAGRFDDSPPGPVLAAIFGFVTVVLPMGLFAQREHAALILAIPALACAALVADRKSMSQRAIAAAGAAAALVVVIKPYFVFAMLAPALWAAWSRRTVGPLLPALVAASIVLLGYGAAILLFAGSYFNWLPVFTHTYVYDHLPLAKVVLGPLIFITAAFAPLLLLKVERVPRLAIAFILAAAGFTLASMVQAKNYPNHWLPGSALALAAGLLVALSPRTLAKRREVVLTLLALGAVWQIAVWTYRPDTALVNAIRRAAPPHPGMMVLSRELTSGHPATREAGGHWVGSRAAQFTAAAARKAGFGDPIALAAYREDIRAFANDVEHKTPDVILVESGDKSWLMAEREVVAAMRPYRSVDKVGNTEIWVRNTGAGSFPAKGVK